MGQSRRTRIILALAAILAVVVPVLTIRRVPVPFADVQLYASIARAVQLFGIGVPTITWNSPVAVDHLPFYGPVFFSLAAVSLHLFGPTLMGFRIVSVAGTLLFIVAAVLLAREGSADKDRWRLAAVLLLVTPQVNAAMTDGAMHMLAVGLFVAALAVFVGGLVGSGRAIWPGAGAGLMLTFAALTTPRSYPFVVGFFCAAAVPGIFGANARAGRRQMAAAMLVFGLMWLIWTTVSHGGPVLWFRYMAYIALHEDTDVAVLPTAVRVLSFSWSGLVSSMIAIGGAVTVALAFARDTADESGAKARGVAFALAATWIGFVVTVVVLNYTFSVADYFVLPLFAVLLATPRSIVRARPALGTAAVAVVLVGSLGVLTVRYARIAATWEARDPDAINRFIIEHVRPGSVVVGPEAPFFFPVERSGSRYRTMSPRSWADWARWVPIVEPEATLVTRRQMVARSRERFLIVPTDDGLEPDYSCAAAHAVAMFRPAPNGLARLGWFGRIGGMGRLGYPESALYRLPPGCPTGYNPTFGTGR